MSEKYRIECSDAIDFLDSLPDDSVDLLFTSPPYEDVRTYGINFKLKGEKWVKWMFSVIQAAAPKVKGLIAVNCEGKTEDYSYSAVPFLLAADLKRAGFNLRKPAVFQRVGIPGSGGPDWLRNDWEPIICITRPGKLPWSDNTAAGHPPKYGPGGELSHRISDGTRVNQWGLPGQGRGRKRNGERKGQGSPSHKIMTRERHGTHSQESTVYDPPAIANPGNVFKIAVGGGHMGHPLASENEAPFPLDLPVPFILSFSPPGGIVCDCFVGSGTVAHAAFIHGRRFVGCDNRQSQVDLAIRRLKTVTPDMFAELSA